MRKQSKKAINLANISWNGKSQAGDMLISFFLTSTGGQGSEQRHFSFNSQAEGRDSLRKPFCMILIEKAVKSKSKEQFQHGAKTDFLPATI